MTDPIKPDPDWHRCNPRDEAALRAYHEAIRSGSGIAGVWEFVLFELFPKWRANPPKPHWPTRINGGEEYELPRRSNSFETYKDGMLSPGD